MTGKMRLYAGLLVLVLVLTGSGLWFLFNPVPTIDIPEGEPVIIMDIIRIMGGEESQLAIYEDGTVIYHEDKGLRPPPPLTGHPPTRTWKTGQLQQEELRSLLEFIKNNGFEELEDGYKFPGKPIEGGGTGYGDMSCIIAINYGDLHKTVWALGYLTPDKGLTYPDMPYPLNEIYKKLKDIAENKTVEVACEPIETFPPAEVEVNEGR